MSEKGFIGRAFLIGSLLSAEAALSSCAPKSGGVSSSSAKVEASIQTTQQEPAEPAERKKEIDVIQEMLKGHNITSHYFEPIADFLNGLRKISQTNYEKAIQKTEGKEEYTINYNQYNKSRIVTILLASDPRDLVSTNERFIVTTNIEGQINEPGFQTGLKNNLEGIFTDMEKPHKEFIGSQSIDEYTDDMNHEHAGSFKMRGWVDASGRENFGHYYIKARPASVSA